VIFLELFQPVAIQSDSSADVQAESQLVDQAKRGDLDAFTQLVNRYERNIFRLARHITQNEEDAEDVLQEAFLKAFANLNQFQGQSKFYTWLVRIAVNESLMKLRRRKADRVVSLDERLETEDDSVPREIASWDENPEQQYGRTELNALLSRVIDSLSPGFRTVFLLRDVEGLSTEETASTLNLSIPAVKSRLLRARLQLREKLNRIFRKHGDHSPVHL
jgi:RNA polymerase sigma-70 factor (ECF subfamily)